ncbi:MAG: universal stress protein [Bacteroidetes bacterium]|nr:universal stress protein [Bacteroidota bacterium]
MKRILVPVDFSGHTDITCSYALELAGDNATEIRLFHSYSDPVIMTDRNFPDTIDMSTMYNEELLKEVFHQAEKKMELLVQSIGEKIQKSSRNNIELQSTVVGGMIERELKDLCLEFHPDLVVMGTRGSGNTLQTWGKVSTYIIKHAKVPVLAVPEINKFMGFREIMLADDPLERVEGSIRKILELFAGFTFHISCVHFRTREEKKEEKEKRELLREKFETEVRSGKISFEMVAVKGEKQKAISEAAEKASTDLIAFQQHSHGLLYNLFTKEIKRKDLRATNIPLLALPDFAVKK